MSIDPEKLLELAKRRHHDGGVTLGWPMVINIVDELRRLQWEREALASLATERAQFILNAVELGYCQLPDSDTPDSARDTYERCKLADSEAVARRDARMKAEELERIERYEERVGIDYLGGFLYARICELRRQAEGITNG